MPETFTPALQEWKRWQALASEKKVVLLRVSARDKATRVAGDLHLYVPVVVADAKFTFGITRVLVEPVGGFGRTWVVPDRLSPIEDGAPGEMDVV